NLEGCRRNRCQSDEKGPAARRRPRAAREAYSLYVERAAEGANAADGPLSSLWLKALREALLFDRMLAVGWADFHARLAGREDLAEAEPMALDDLVHAAEHVGQLGARDDAVHHHVGGRYAAVGAEGRLAALPQELALRLVLRGPHLARARVAAGLDHALGLRLHTGGEPVQLDQERRRRVARVAAAERVLHGLHREVIDDLHGGGDEPPAE